MALPRVTASLRVYATRELDLFVTEVTAEYRGILVGPGSRVVRGEVLWYQFEDAVAEYHASRGRGDRRLKRACRCEGARGRSGLEQSPH
jgi:hypothetical protein